MNEYNPDGWGIVKIIPNDKEPIYKVFGSWGGGYLDGDSWRLNSGIVSFSEDDEYYYFGGSSGSVYKCYKGGEGNITAYNLSIINKMIDRLNASNGGKAICLLVEEFKNEFRPN